jgi:tetratricopeptide (TPR) repeat protein
MSENDAVSNLVEDMNIAAPPTVQMADERYHKGILAVKNHCFVEALHHFSKAVFLASGEPLPYIARAEAYMHLHDLKSAISNYRKALTLMKDPVAAADLRVRLAQVLDTQGISSFRAGDTPVALMYAEESIAVHRTNLAELHKVLYLIDAGDDDAAERILSSVLVHDQAVAAEATALVIRLHISRRQDFATSKRLLEDVLFRHSRHPHVLDAEKFFDESFATFRQQAMDRRDIDALSKCVLAFPEDADLYMQRAVAYCNKKMYTYAVQDVFSCITKSGGSNEDANGMMMNILSAIADELRDVGDLPAAVNYYGEALKWDEKALDVLLSRGDCYVALSKHEEGLKDFKSVVAIDEVNAGAKERLCKLYDYWGSVFYNDGKYELAEAEFTRAILVADELAMPYYHRAMARLMLQKQAYAVRDLMSCKVLGIEEPNAVKMINQFCGNYVPTPSVGGGTDASGMLPSATPNSSEARSVRSFNTAKASRASSDAVIIDPLGELRKSTVIEPQVSHGSASLRTPAGLRDSLANIRCAVESSIVVTLNPISQAKTVHHLSRNGTVMSTAQTKNGVSTDDGLRWRTAQKKHVSRFTAVVSAPEPVPAKYARRSDGTLDTSGSTEDGGRHRGPSDPIPVVPPATVSHPHRTGAGSIRIPSHASPHAVSASAPEQFVIAKNFAAPPACKGR